MCRSLSHFDSTTLQVFNLVIHSLLTAFDNYLYVEAHIDILVTHIRDHHLPIPGTEITSNGISCISTIISYNRIYIRINTYQLCT